MPVLQLFTFLQCFASLLLLGIAYGFMCLCITLIAVACAHFEKLASAILDIRQQHITPHYEQEDGQVHETASNDLQAKLNSCILQHQEIMAYVRNELRNTLV